MAEAPKVEVAAAQRDRSPRYASIGPTKAIEFANLIWKKDKRNPVSVDMACQHMGYKAKNGASATVLAALKQYGLIVPVGKDVRISDDAHTLFLAPHDHPQRAELLRKIAMTPELFEKVLSKFPDGFPSDANLRFRLMGEFGFVVPEAADNFIAALHDAVAVRDANKVAEKVKSTDTATDVNVKEPPPMSQNSPSSETSSIAPPPPPHVAKASGHTETHKWKLGDGVWAEITISGSLGPKGFDKLKKYVELIDVADDEGVE